MLRSIPTLTQKKALPEKLKQGLKIRTFCLQKETKAKFLSNRSHQLYPVTVVRADFIAPEKFSEYDMGEFRCQGITG